MKLLCECGHPNHLHFAGTGHCHQVMEWVRSERRSVRCSCERFVPELVRERKDTA